MFFRKTKYSDQELLEGIRNHDRAVQEDMYRRFLPRIQALVLSRGGTEAAARDIFQEVMIVLFLNANRPDFQLSSALYTFMHAVAERMWLKEFRRGARYSPVSIDQAGVLTSDTQADAALEYAERLLFLQEKFEALGDPCRSLLMLSILEEKKPDEVMPLLNIDSKSYYYKLKSDCKKKLIELVQGDARFGSI